MTDEGEVARRPPGGGGPQRAWLPVAGFLLCLASCSGRGDGTLPTVDPLGGERPTGLLVITLDTTRADRIGAYGHREAHTPHIDDLADRGVLFEEAVTPVPLTVPAHASLFTGYQPPHHGVRTNEGRLQDGPNVTLAEMLRERGFRTAAFLGAAVLRRWSGMDQGFESYSDEFPYSGSPFDSTFPEKRAEEVVGAAVEWLATVGDEPYLLWVHLFDPHAPYAPPDRFVGAFERRPYDGEIAYGDEQIGVLLAALDRLGLRDRTLIALLSDHGESLGEHREEAHGFFLYDATLRIPFILSCPAVLPQRMRVPTPVEIVDFVPTALNILDVGEGIATGGRSLLPLVSGERPEAKGAYAESHYPLETHGWSPLAALRRGGFKVVRAPVPELYDLEADPSERRSVFAERRDLGEAMLAELATLEREITRELPASDPTFDPVRRRMLETLGYVVGGTVDVDATDRLPDPKERVATLVDLRRARQLLAERRPREAVAMLSDLARREPRSPSVFELLGSTLLAGRHFDGASKAYARVLELDPDNDRALINVGTMAAMAGDFDGALTYLEKAYALIPDDPIVLLNLGQILFEVRGDEERGRPHLERFLELAPDDPDADKVRALLSGASRR